MDSNSNTYLYFFVFVLCLLPTDLTGQEFIHQNQTEIIGCGGNDYKYANHTVQFYRASLNSSVTLTSCGDPGANTTIYWYAYTDLCLENKIQNSYFASVNFNSPPSNNSPCLQGRNLTISSKMCNSSFEFSRYSMVIKSLTHETARRYMCFRGMGPTSILNSSAVSYNISIDGKSVSPHSNGICDNLAMVWKNHVILLHCLINKFIVEYTRAVERGHIQAENLFAPKLSIRNNDLRFILEPTTISPMSTISEEIVTLSSMATTTISVTPLISGKWVDDILSKIDRLLSYALLILFNVILLKRTTSTIAVSRKILSAYPNRELAFAPRPHVLKFLSTLNNDLSVDSST